MTSTAQRVTTVLTEIIISFLFQVIFLVFLKYLVLFMIQCDVQSGTRNPS